MGRNHRGLEGINGISNGRATGVRRERSGCITVEMKSVQNHGEVLACKFGMFKRKFFCLLSNNFWNSLNIDIVFFEEVPNILMIFGTIVVIFSGIYIAYREHRLSTKG